jgi:exopolysaccharide biosynthesis protein
MKRRSVRPIIRGILRTLAVLLILVLCLLVFLISAIATVFKGPSDTMKNLLVNTFMETSALKFIPKMYFSEEEIDTIMRGDTDAYNEYIASLDEVEIVIPPQTEEVYNELDPDGDGIIIEDVYGKTYCGKMMIVLDPSRVSIEIIDSFSESGNGLLLSELAKEEGVTAAFNGGGFLDNYGLGNGGMPIGVTIKDGVLKQDYDWMYPTTIGFDKDHKLIVGNMSGQQALDAGIVEAASFGPVLVKNGVIAPNNGTGLNPRTAIGQREDGAILVLAIDGRQPHSLGASYQDLSEIMEDYGAVNAANLDGGSSSMLFYNGEMLNSLGSAVGERRIPTAFVVR